MCGIAGALSFDPRVSIDRDRVVRMRDTLEHRGPDGAGLWAEGQIALGHRRLAIVDVSGGHQPMANEDESVWLVFNGEIYNHAELRPGLIQRGHVYRTRSDTETIVHLYDEYGAAGFERLEGMFAFALWDVRRTTLWLVRDRLGIKPLYYATDGGELLFASEIKALIAGGIRPTFNASVLNEYLANRYVAGERTFFEGVTTVEPGHVVRWSPAEGVQVRRFWSLPAPGASTAKSFEQEAADLRERLRGAVRRHLMSDVPLGVFLSGGLDSSALAATAAELVPDPVQTFAVGFNEAEGNELPYARSVAKAIGADHREVVVTPDMFFSALPSLVWHQDEPMAFSSSVPLHFVSALARPHVKVVLTGEGADELFLGYNRYRVTHWNHRLGTPYWAMTPAKLRSGVRSIVKRLPAQLRRYSERSFLGVEGGSRDLFFDNFAVFPSRWRSLLLDPAALAQDPYAVGLGCYDAAGGRALDRMSATDLQTYLVELLMKQDRMSMAASIESRVPFLDDRLVAHVVGLPASLKLRGWTTKAVLRRAVRDLLPAEILTRPKMGFPVPLARWFRTRFSRVIDEFVLGGRARARAIFDPNAVRRLNDEHRSGAADHGERLWLLVTLEIWQRIFIDGEVPSEVMRPVERQLGTTYAIGLDQNGRSVAAQHRRPATYVPDAVGLVAPASRHAGHHART
jgi:asparagine synthase (glutamine-hydrolysing)